MQEKVRIILADDHALILDGLRTLLSADSNFLVIATATDGERLLDAVKRFSPDLVITDIKMPYMDGLECLSRIRQLCPETRVLFLTGYSDDETLEAVARSGVDGLLLKSDPPHGIVQAVQQVLSGQLVFPAVARRWLFGAKLSTPEMILSERESEVLALVAEGLTNSQVAADLHISENTVKFHLQNIYESLNVTNRTEASRWFHQNM